MRIGQGLARRFAVFALTVSLFPMLVNAQSAIGSLLEEVTVAAQEQGTTIHISFSCPVRYITHFPQDSAVEVRIKLKPFLVCSADSEFVNKRASIIPEFGETAALTEVTYEGDIQGGPFLSLHFSRPVLFEIFQGSDFRSITVVVYDGP